MQLSELLLEYDLSKTLNNWGQSRAINEAIDASGIDREARTVLKKAINEWVGKLWDDFHTEYQKNNSGDIHAAYDAFCEQGYDEIHARQLEEICSKTLTALTQKHLELQYGPMIKRKGTHSIWVDDVIVKVEDRETSEDLHKDYGGYFQPGSHLIKVFVDRHRLNQELRSAIQIHVFGESYEENSLVKLITPTFIHEYTHLEQNLRGGHIQGERDRGYITIGGGKFGGRRTPNKGKIEMLRYASSSKEIDSFAADTASSLFNGFGRDYSINDDIKKALEEMAAGYGVENFERYAQLRYQTFEGRFAHLGLKPEEMEYVWKRFLKLVYRKLIAYRINTEESYRDPPVWKVVAKKGLKAAAPEIAQDVASKILNDHPYETDVDYIMRYPGQLASDAVMFLQRNFFRDQWDYGTTTKLENIFHGLLRRQLQKIIKARR